ncbi:hypothetical protein KCU81_g2077, partial [Aureobasidium melanogenum]
LRTGRRIRPARRLAEEYGLRQLLIWRQSPIRLIAPLTASQVAMPALLVLWPTTTPPGFSGPLFSDSDTTYQRFPAVPHGFFRPRRCRRSSSILDEAIPPNTDVRTG